MPKTAVLHTALLCFAAALLVTVLAFLYTKTQAVDLRRQNEILEFLRELKEIDSRWDLDLHRARAELAAWEPPAGNRGRAAGTGVKMKIIDVMCRILLFPKLPARGRIETFHHLHVIDAMKQNQFATADHRPGEALSHLPLPGHRWSFLRPLRGEFRVARRPVPVRPQELRPILSTHRQRQPD